MDMTIGVFLKKALPKWWIIALCALIGLGSAFYYTKTIIPTYYSEATLIGVNFDKIISYGSVSLDEISVSKKLATEFLPLATSGMVASRAATELSNYGYNLRASQIQGMVTAKVSSNLVVIRASSNNRNIVMDVANEVGSSFIESLGTITGVSYFDFLDRAESVTTVSGVNKMLYMMAGLLAGGVIGAAIVFLIVLFTRKIKMVEDLANLKAVNNLMLIPNHGIKY